jgi:hypothetical protein
MGVDSAAALMPVKERIARAETIKSSQEEVATVESKNQVFDLPNFIVSVRDIQDPVIKGHCLRVIDHYRHNLPKLNKIITDYLKHNKYSASDFSKSVEFLQEVYTELFPSFESSDQLRTRDQLEIENHLEARFEIQASSELVSDYMKLSAPIERTELGNYSPKSKAEVILQEKKSLTENATLLKNDPNLDAKSLSSKIDTLLEEKNSILIDISKNPLNLLNQAIGQIDAALKIYYNAGLQEDADVKNLRMLRYTIYTSYIESDQDKLQQAFSLANNLSTRQRSMSTTVGPIVDLLNDANKLFKSYQNDTQDFTTAPVKALEASYNQVTLLNRNIDLYKQNLEIAKQIEPLNQEIELLKAQSEDQIKKKVNELLQKDFNEFGLNYQQLENMAQGFPDTMFYALDCLNELNPIYKDALKNSLDSSWVIDYAITKLNDHLRTGTNVNTAANLVVFVRAIDQAVRL